ncbi:elastin binding protein [Staphylococcus gallinarum]|uniref:Elastin binding protein n=1 Tax=Staphylococcus gallinarum TaxID=1293 RepID=A0A380FIW6_STAGA|nr:elastin binding protein [Staphylococcus gallinarum]
MISQQVAQNSSQDSQQSTNTSGQRTHVVNGQNLYRIAIQYYGEGTPENGRKNKTS